MVFRKKKEVHKQIVLLSNFNQTRKCYPHLLRLFAKYEPIFEIIICLLIFNNSESREDVSKLEVTFKGS